jgi:hypothetical protein
MRVLIFLLCATASVWAQDKPKFDRPQPAPKLEAKTAGDAGDDELQATIRRLAGWPSERAQRAAERLIVQKERSLAPVQAVLMDPRAEAAPYKAGAAYVMGRIGEPNQALTLLLIATERRQQRHAATFLDAAWRLDPAVAVSEAFRFFHLSETTLRNEAFKFVLARVTKDHLPAIRDLLDRRLAEKSFTREIGLRLLDRLIETEGVTWADVSDRFYRALGDESPQVASRVMRVLAGRNDAENVKALNDLITKDVSYWRQRSYAALALGIMSAGYKIQPLEEQALEVL